MKKKFIKPTILLLFVIVAVYIGKFTEAASYLSREAFEQTIANFGVFGPLFFMGIYFIGTIFFLPGTPLSILSGVLFGSLWGTVYVVIGATLGASVAFLVARYLAKDYIDSVLKDKFKALDKYDHKLENKGFLTTLFLRFIPLFPFNGLNFALGLTRVKFKDYFLGTLIGIIPGSFILVNLGSSSADLSSPKFYAFIGLFLFLAFVPSIYKKVRKIPEDEITS